MLDVVHQAEMFWMDRTQLTEHKSRLFKDPAGAGLSLCGPESNAAAAEGQNGSGAPIDRLLFSTA